MITTIGREEVRGGEAHAGLRLRRPARLMLVAYTYGIKTSHVCILTCIYIYIYIYMYIYIYI